VPDRHIAPLVSVRADDLADVLDRVFTLPLGEQPHWKTLNRLTSSPEVNRRLTELSEARRV